MLVAKISIADISEYWYYQYVHLVRRNDKKKNDIYETNEQVAMELDTRNAQPSHHAKLGSEL